MIVLDKFRVGEFNTINAGTENNTGTLTVGTQQSINGFECMQLHGFVLPFVI